MNDYMQVWAPTPEDHLAYLLAQIYIADCEAHDRKVCTGPLTPDGVMPANPHELVRVNQHSNKVRTRVAHMSQRLDVSYQLVKKWIARL